MSQPSRPLVLAIRMMAERGLNTLILVHRRQLMDQWIERLTAFSSLRKSEKANNGPFDR